MFSIINVVSSCFQTPEPSDTQMHGRQSVAVIADLCLSVTYLVLGILGAASVLPSGVGIAFSVLCVLNVLASAGISKIIFGSPQQVMLRNFS